MTKATLISTRDLTSQVRHFDFEVEGQALFPFAAGQFISVLEKIDGKEITRAYSLASAPDGNRFALCLNRVEDGKISPLLFQMSVGEQVSINPPLGYFTLRHPGRHAVMIATGTGVAPFRSMLLHHMGRSLTSATLLLGARYPEGVLYKDEFDTLTAQESGFRFLSTVTRPPLDWPGRSGRVMQHLDEALTIPGSPVDSEIDVYICGLNQMVDDVRSELKSRGFDRKHIIYEKYD